MGGTRLRRLVKHLSYPRLVNRSLSRIALRLCAQAQCGALGRRAAVDTKLTGPGCWTESVGPGPQCVRPCPLLPPTVSVCDQAWASHSQIIPKFATLVQYFRRQIVSKKCLWQIKETSSITHNIGTQLCSLEPCWILSTLTQKELYQR